jgi:heme/copper-type cytochrome/quinol oxidase subunit 1
VYLLGFITHLIFGMAVRMIPGFMTQRQVASPLLVDLTLWFGTAAVVCRVLLFMLPAGVVTVFPASLLIAKAAFAWSGVLAWIAVACLATNLWRTVGRRARMRRTSG